MELTKEQEQELFWKLCDSIKAKFSQDATVLGDEPENIRVVKIDMRQPIIARSINWLEDAGYIQKTEDPTIYTITLEYYEYLMKNAD